MKFAQIAKRILLFVVVNILVMTTIMIVLTLLSPYLSHFKFHGRSVSAYYANLLLFCSIWGMAGAFISLGLSRIMAKWMMGVRVIDPNTRDTNERWLVDTVHNLARTAGLPKMPEVGIYESPEVNAFATGPSKSRSLVAVSAGLLDVMGPREAEGVLGHEIAHIANGDMVTLTLIQGVINAFVMFFARIAATLLTQNSSRDDNRGGNSLTYFILVQVFQMVFSILGFMVVAWFSRKREFRADAGGARYAGKPNMVNALRALKAVHDQGADNIGQQQPAFSAFKISGKTGGIGALFATHPPIEARIARLENTVAV